METFEDGIPVGIHNFYSIVNSSMNSPAGIQIFNSVEKVGLIEFELKLLFGLF